MYIYVQIKPTGEGGMCVNPVRASSLEFISVENALPEWDHYHLRGNNRAISG